MAVAISFFLLSVSIARHHHEPEFKRLNRRMARKNLIALVIYIAAIAMAFIYTPLALVMIALPASMYFLPKRGIGRFEH
jgi:phosphatidylserine synthase